MACKANALELILISGVRTGALSDKNMERRLAGWFVLVAIAVAVAVVYATFLSIGIKLV